ncbi:(2Fe-2S)-binding protein [Pelagibacterium luteolum]|uniref:Isoquinoline 1-oxidoreductase, alpha subunit n=1 Tax=Pelagibacterium luteolum TaxID=440168 RepID=A0A1G7W1E9_9HYPH|nr:(2Fe-2S)-binding protein [Pelagibacterium luteolum]SDG65796.1 isoquinoline 1-oxidoreductase, alpha subunit [Pelagibacterium luteolum]
MTDFTLNGTTVSVDVPEDTPLLWVIRDELGMHGTKFGCGVAACGACTVHLDGQMTRSCVTTLGSVAGREVTTIEGLGDEHPLQQAWIEHQVPQCGYCQSGQIMSAAALLAQNPSPTREEIKTHMNGNICRCGTYPRIVAAIESVSEEA